MTIPSRQRRLSGRHALVDGIPFQLPVNSEDSPALMAGFTVDADRAQALLPGEELAVLRLPRNRALLLVTVIDYRTTDIGSYVEFSVAFACTHGEKPQSLLPAVLFRGRSGVGQYVWDLPVSTLVSVKGGKGIWGMPKHQANLDFRVSDSEMSSQYDLDGKLCLRITVRRPRWLRVPLHEMGAVNYCQFRGMLVKSSIYFSDRVEFGIGPTARAQLLLGDHPRMDPLRALDTSERPLFTACMPHSHGVLDDHFESWFLTAAEPPDPRCPPEGLGSVVGLPNDTSLLPAPQAAGR
jgi:hypothetical protein